MVWAGWLLIENKERKLHSLYFPSYTEMLFLQITSQLWNYETMKKAIFLEGPLQKWTITWSWLFHVYVYFFFFFFSIKIIVLFASPTHTEEGNRFFRETWLMHFLMHFPAKNRKIFKIGFVEDIFRTFSFLKYITIFFWYSFWLVGRKRVPAWMSKMFVHQEDHIWRLGYFPKDFIVWFLK